MLLLVSQKLIEISKRRCANFRTLLTSTFKQFIVRLVRYWCFYDDLVVHIWTEVWIGLEINLRRCPGHPIAFSTTYINNRDNCSNTWGAESWCSGFAVSEMLSKKVRSVKLIALFALQALTVLDELLIFKLFFNLFLKDWATFLRLINCMGKNLVVPYDFSHLRLIENWCVICRIAVKSSKNFL